MVGIYFAVSLCRLISFGLFQKWIFTLGYGCTISEFIIYVHGGLRGAVGLAFALLANADESLTPGLRDIVN